MYILYIGVAMEWILNTPKIRALINKRDTARKEDIEEFYTSMRERFPVITVTTYEAPVWEEIKTLKQGPTKTVSDYYQRAAALLRRTRGSDGPRNDSESSTMSQLDRTNIGHLLTAVAQGIRLPELQTKCLSQGIYTCRSLWRAGEIM
jgi:hypothetical protein